MKNTQYPTVAVLPFAAMAVLLAWVNPGIEAAQPSLSVARSGSDVEVSWDANAIGSVLQFSPLLDVGEHWLAPAQVPTRIAAAGAQLFPVSSDPAIFYRTLLLDPHATRSLAVPELQFAARGVPPGDLKVLLLPESQLIEIGATATFAALVDGYTGDATNLVYRWEVNKLPYAVSAAGSTNLTWRDLNIGQDTNFVTLVVTNSNFYTIPAVTTNDVGYYRVTVTAPGPSTVSSLAAPLWAWQQTNSIVVFGTPVTQSGSGSCSGAYSKRIEFGGYWPAQRGPYAATSWSGGGDTIAWHDYYNASYGCQGGSFSLTVKVPVPYYFTIYTSNSNPPNPYVLYLQGFQ
ncbi:MAG: hypothetical protein U1G07_12375 [Verrucomicrobiota bacterium]